MAADLELAMSGGVAAALGGRPVDLGGTRQRTLLAALVVSYPYEVSAERLLEQVWHDSPDPKPGSLHVAISKLRDRLDPGRARGAEGTIARTGTRYRLDVRPEQIDTVYFAELVAHGDRLCEDDSDDAARSYEAALALWRGAPFADIADSSFVRDEIARLEALELRARKALTRIRLDRGELDAATESAVEITGMHPLDEHAWELRILALYRSGRQSDALAALRRVRSILDDELGIEPGFRLRELETAVLRQDDSRLLGPHPAPPAAARSTSSNLRMPRTLLVGRMREVHDIARAAASNPLTTLVGPGGVGKTRLAVEVCRQAGTPADGTWFVDLAAVRSGHLVAATIATCLQLNGPGTADQLADALSDRECVVVLDNCEHVIDDCAEVANALLDRCPNLRILATSREPLGVESEFVFDVEPLGIEDAVDLFTDRAAGIVPGWELSAHDTDVVRQICSDLDGIPLGIELAAAQLRMLSERQIAEGLTDRFALLHGGPRTAPERQRRLSDTIDWSYRLLDDDSARVLRLISVFAGPFDIEGAAAVTGGVSAFAPLEPLTALVRRSLLHVESASSPRRYRLLQTVRQFASSRMSAAERRQAEQSHRRFVLERATAASRHLRDARASQSLAILSADVAEHRAAAESALAQEDPAFVLEPAGALYWFWYRHGHLREGLQWVRAAFESAETCPDRADHRILMSAYSGQDALQYLSGDTGAATESLEAAAAIADRIGDSPTSAWMRSWATYCRAVAATDGSLLDEARACTARLREHGEPWQVAELLMIEGMLLRYRGYSAQAHSALRQSVTVAERCGHRWAVASASWTLFRAAMDIDDVDAAVDAARTMHAVLESEGDVTSWLVLVHSISTLAVRLGCPADGATLLGAVQTQGARIGFLPESMDPVEGPREAALVRESLDPSDFAVHYTAGAALSHDEVNALVWELCERGRSLTEAGESAISAR